MLLLPATMPGVPLPAADPMPMLLAAADQIIECRLPDADIAVAGRAGQRGSADRDVIIGMNRRYQSVLANCDITAAVRGG